MKRFAHYSQEHILMAMALPTVCYIILFKFIPFIGNVIAFEDYKLLLGVFKSPWVGLEHFRRLFQSKVFWSALKNTLRLNVLSLFIGFPFTIFLALVLAEIKIRFRNALQVFLYIPYFISWAALGGIIVQMLSPSIGIVAAIGKLFSIDYSDLPFLLGDERSWVLVFVLTGIWQSAGWGTIVYISAITGLEPTLYESARIDGASRFQQCLYITFPLIIPTILIMLLLKIASILSTSFEQIYALSNTMVLGVSDVLSTYEYRAGLRNMQFSFATAIGLFESILGLCFVIIAQAVIRHISTDRAYYE